MSDIQAMQAQLVDDIAAAADLDALEALRVAALGKSGSVSALLKTLGGMSPEERQSEGPRIHALREAVHRGQIGRFVYNAALRVARARHQQQRLWRRAGSDKHIRVQYWRVQWPFFYSRHTF